MEKVSKYSGLALLIIGLVILFVVFFLAYMEYVNVEKPSIAEVSNLIAWIMEWGTYIVIKIAFLGIMGWVGSIITMRAVSLLTAKTTVTAKPETVPETEVYEEAEVYEER